MAISDAQKVDYLLKKIGYGISKTDTSTNKSPANESVASPLLLRGDNLYAQSDLISVVGTLPASNSSVVTVYRDSLSSAVLSVNDGTAATNRTWKTNLTDWVGPEFGSGYAVKVYTGTVQTAANASSGTSLPVDGSGNNDSWFFDYQSGVLNFADTNVPSSIAAQVWVVGARYTGQKGITSLLSTSTVGTANVGLYSQITSLTNSQTYYPQFGNITSGNSVTGATSTLTWNPGTGTFSAPIINTTGNAQIGGNLIVVGNLTVQGNSTTIGSSDLTVTDSIINLHTFANLAAWTTNDGRDIGVKFHYYDSVLAGGDNHAFLGRANDTGFLEFYTTGSEVGNVFTGTAYGTIKTGNLVLANSTVSTSSTTGALVVAGGVGIGGAMYTTGLAQHGAGLQNTIIGNATASSATFTTVVSGGLQATAIGNVTPGTAVFTTATTGGLQATAIGNVTPGSGAFTTGTFSSTLGVTGATTMTTATAGGLQATAIGNVTPGSGAFTTATTGGLQATAIGNVTPGTGVFTTATTGGLQATAIGNVTAGSGAFTTLSASTWANITGTTAATSTTTGALVVAGGAGVGGALYIGSTATITGNTAVNNTLYGQGIYDNGTRVASTSGGPGNVSIVAGNVTLPLTGQGITTAGSTTSVPVVTTDAYGRVTALTSASISTVPTANVSLFDSVTAYTTNQTFYGIFSNISTTGNTTQGVSGNFTFNPSTGALGTTLINTSGVITSSGNIVAASGTNSTSATTGAVTIAGNGGLGVTGNAFFGNSVTINSTQTAGQDFIVRGKNSSTTLWVRPSATYDQVLIGGNATPSTFYSGAALQINTTDSLLLPVGSTAQRPSGAGFTDATGMLRYSTTTGAIEWYTGSAWQSASTQFTLISDDQFNGDGTTVAFTMGAASTTSAAIVSINGVIQIPTLAYSCSSTTITFTEAPASGDVIDVRRLTTTQTITNIASTNGYMQFVTDNSGAYVYTGTSSSVATTYWDTAGAQVGNLANTAVASANTATTIDTMATGTYRSAKYVIQATNGASYQVMEALLISNGTTATVLAYGTVQTAGNLGVVTATQSGSNALLQFVAANSSTNVRITKDYLLI